MGRRRRAHEAARGADRQGLRRREEPAARLGSIRCGVQHAGDDGHRPEPRAEPGDGAGAHRADRQRAVRLGRVAPVRRDVRADRARPEGRGLRRALRRGQAQGQGQARHRPDRRPAAPGRRSLHEDRGREDGGAVPDRSVSAARARRAGGVRLLVRQARPRLPRVQQDPPRSRHRGERRDDGLRQHGRRFGHRRRLHARPEYRGAGDLRRVPDERAGRGRRGRRPHAREDQPDARRAAGGVRAVRGDRPTPRGALPRDAGPRVHDRARHPLHAADALREADGAGGGEDRGRHGQRGRHHEGGGDPAGRPRADRPAPAPTVRRVGEGQGRRTDCSARA